MIKIKVFDISLTVMAVAALIFLLPPDRETPAGAASAPNTTKSFHNDSKAVHESPVLVDISRAT